MHESTVTWRVFIRLGRGGGGGGGARTRELGCFPARGGRTSTSVAEIEGGFSENDAAAASAGEAEGHFFSRSMLLSDQWGLSWKSGVIEVNIV